MMKQKSRFPVIAGTNRRATAALTFLVASACMAQAATIPITFTFTGGDSGVPGQIPSPGNPTVGTNLMGTASFIQFGSATVTASGGTGVTFTTYPPGIFAPASLADFSKFSFNGGVDTFTATDSVLFGPPTPTGQSFTGSFTITSGTGIFTGATGLVTTTGMATPPPGPGLPGQVAFSGRGQITAPGLPAAVPEPSTMLLIGGGLAGLIAWRKSGV